MRKSRKKNKARNQSNKLVKIDHYYLPADQAEKYQLLREAISKEIFEWAEEKFDHVAYTYDQNIGEGIAGFVEEKRVFTYWLDPTSISKAQIERFKERLPLYLERHIKH